MRRLGDPCLLEDRICTECGECDNCELDPKKICDNCCRCIDESRGDYAEIVIDDILFLDEDLALEKVRSQRQPKKPRGS